MSLGVVFRSIVKGVYFKQIKVIIIEKYDDFWFI